MTDITDLGVDVYKKFPTLFQGRLDAYGTNEGGCDRLPEPPMSQEDAWREYQRRTTAHLVGSNPMGVYPLRDDNTVMWGCTDLDGGDDDYPNAEKLHDALWHVGLNGWIEMSRSKGWHVWTFASEPVPALAMREALLGLHQALDIPADEVNPKQTSIKGGQLGNYVRLPYPGGAYEPPERQVILGAGSSRLSVERFVEEALAKRSPANQYLTVGARYYLEPPAPVEVNVTATTTPVTDEVLAKLNKAGYLAWKFGPSEGYDRSSSLVRLAYLCHESGLTPDEGFAVVADLDRRIGKFHGREDAAEQLLRIVDRAYSRPSTT